MKGIGKKTILKIVDQIDSSLKNHVKKINIYCVGGTALTMIGKKYSSTDIDFIVPHEDLATITSITAEIEYKEKIAIDVTDALGLWGNNMGYALPPDYKERSRKISSCENLNLFVLCELDLLVTKAIAGRQKDHDDIRRLVKKIKKQDVIERFKQYKLPTKIKNNLENNLKDFFERNNDLSS